MRKISSLLLLMLAQCSIIHVIVKKVGRKWISVKEELFSQAQPRYYHTGIECSGSLTCIAPFCYLSTQRNYVLATTTINTGCTLVRPLLKINVSWLYDYSSTDDWFRSFQGSTSYEEKVWIVQWLQANHFVSTNRVVQSDAGLCIQSCVQADGSGSQQLGSRALPHLSLLGEIIFEIFRKYWTGILGPSVRLQHDTQHGQDLCILRSWWIQQRVDHLRRYWQANIQNKNLHNRCLNDYDLELASTWMNPKWTH